MVKTDMRYGKKTDVAKFEPFILLYYIRYHQTSLYTLMQQQSPRADP